MSQIPKFCHNKKCMYVYTSDSELDVYADYDAFCPNCQPTATDSKGDIPSCKSEMPDWLIGGLIRLWWRKFHMRKRRAANK